MRPPIFVGGTGRSGTTPTARILGTHSKVARFPELRVHVQMGGVVDLMLGRTTYEAFAARCRGRWFRRPDSGGEGPYAGLFRFISEDDIEGLLGDLESDLAIDRIAATGDFIRGILGPAAEAMGKDGWVEHSPENVTVAAALYAMFPQQRFIHSVRDGRDVAASILKVRWGPDNIAGGIRWWGHRLRLAQRELDAIPSDQVIVLRYEELIGVDRHQRLGELLEFAGLDEERAVHRYFDETIVAPKAHTGRWKDQVGPGEHADIDRFYRGVIDSLRDDNVPLPLGAPQERGDELAVIEQRRYEAAADIEAVTGLINRLGPALDAEGLEGPAERELERAEIELVRLKDTMAELGET